MRKMLSKIWLFVTKERNKLCFALLIISFLIMIFAAATVIKRNYIFTFGDSFNRPEMLLSDNTAAQFGKRKLNKQEYSFLYYSCLYSCYPELKSMRFNQINNYINSTPFGNSEEGDDNISIAQKMQKETEDTIIKMYSYLQDAADKEIKIDSKHYVDAYILSLTQEASKLDMELDDYLSAYYGVTSEQITDVITDFQSYKCYKDEILKSSSYNLSDSEYEQRYKESKEILDLYYISVLAYGFDEKDGDDERSKIKESLKELYERTHSREDFIKLAAEFCNNHKEEIENGKLTLVTDDHPYDYAKLLVLGYDVLDWVTDESRQKDSAALFDLADGYMVVYFSGREIDNRDTYNGLYILADRKFEVTDGYVKMPSTYQAKEESPYYQVIRDVNDKISKIDDKELSNEKILDILTSIDVHQYSKDNEDLAVYPSFLENSLLPEDIASDNITDWASSCGNNSYKIINDNPYFSLLYISSLGLPNYKANISRINYQAECENIETSYSPMFENIVYIHD